MGETKALKVGSSSPRVFFVLRNSGSKMRKNPATCKAQIQPRLQGPACGTFSVFERYLARADHRGLVSERQELNMGFGRGALFWLLGIPLPIIILLAIFWHR